MIATSSPVHGTTADNKRSAPTRRKEEIAVEQFVKEALERNVRAEVEWRMITRTTATPFAK